MIPTFDFETRSAAGFVWDEEEDSWTAPPGAADNGLTLVGVKNYVNHPTFKVLCLSYDLFDGHGVSLWTPGQPNPGRLLRHIALRGILAAWNVAFEMEVWNSFCVKEFGWPPLLLEQLRCDMAAARAWALPGKLADAGEVLKLDIQKDKGGSALVKKFTQPRQPTKKNQAIWNEPDDPDAPPPKPKKVKAAASDTVGDILHRTQMDAWKAGGMVDDDIPF